MLVTDRRRVHGRDLLRAILSAVRGGVGIVQVREKDLPESELESLLRELRASLPEETVVVVNDRPALAETLGIGLHLPAREAFRVRDIHPLGRSVHDEAELREALELGADYLSAGTIFESASKPGRTGAGVDHLRLLTRLAPGVPIYAIGGVSVSHVPDVVHAGAHGVAVCGAILGSADPERAAQAFTLALAVARA